MPMVRGLTCLVILMLLFGAGGPMSSMVTSPVGAAPAEEDEHVQTTKPASQLAQSPHQPRRCVIPNSASRTTPVYKRLPISLSHRINASTAFLAVGRLPLTC